MNLAKDIVEADIYLCFSPDLCSVYHHTYCGMLSIAYRYNILNFKRRTRNLSWSYWYLFTCAARVHVADSILEV